MLCGYQAVYDRDFQDAIDYAADNGFGYVSFDLNVPCFYIDRLTDSELRVIRRHADHKTIGLAFHTPGDNISLFSDYPAVRQGILDHFGAIVDAAERLGARHVVVHPGIYPSVGKANSREDDFVGEHDAYFSAVLYDNLARLADRTKNVMLCVENYHFTPLTMDAVGRLLSESERLFLTWDIAKTYDIQLRRNESVAEFMWTHKDRIREIHAHDTIKEFRSHQIIGKGGIDFREYAQVIQSPDVAVTFEVRPREAAKASMDNLIAMLK